MSQNVRYMPQREEPDLNSIVRSIVREELLRIERERAVPETKDELTVEQVAERKGVKPRTVYEWVHADKIKYHKTPGGRLRFYASDL